MSGTPTFLTVEEAADAMRIALLTVYRKIRAGAIPSKRIGKRILVPANCLTDSPMDAQSDVKPQPMQANSNDEIRISRELKQIEPHLQKMLSTAPENGLCGIELVMQDRCIAKIRIRTETDIGGE